MRKIAIFFLVFPVSLSPFGCALSGGPRESVKPGINDNYLDPELVVDEWIRRFEIESREVYRCRRDVASRLIIKPGDTVADVGAGTGMFIPVLADLVTEHGEVVAVDIVPKFLEHIDERAKEEGLKNVRTHLSKEDSIKLRWRSLDVIFTSDTYHHFEYPEPVLKSMYHALRPGGQLYVLDFERIEGVSREWLLNHVRAGKDVVRQEIEAAGFKFVEEVTPDCLEENYVMRFLRP